MIILKDMETPFFIFIQIWTLRHKTQFNEKSLFKIYSANKIYSLLLDISNYYISYENLMNFFLIKLWLLKITHNVQILLIISFESSWSFWEICERKASKKNQKNVVITWKTFTSNLFLVFFWKYFVENYFLTSYFLT